MLPIKTLLLAFISTSFAAQYFVQLKAPSTFEALLQSDDTVRAIHHLRPLVEKSISFGSFEGFTAHFDLDVLSRLEKNPLVEEITQDIQVSTCNELEDMAVDSEASEEWQNSTEVLAGSFLTQENAPRHLARLSSRYGIDELVYHYPQQYQGEGAVVYVLDTGVKCDHPEFEGRCEFGADFTGEGTTDENGHGTHVAGIVGSKTYGVAKKVNIVAVKALNSYGSGTLSSIILGIEYVVKHHRENTSNIPAVINLSIGAFRNSVLNKAIEVAYDNGVVLVAAAGNNGVDACSFSPASAKSAITVGAIDDRTDTLAGFSNWGRCVNILASGVKVQSLNARDDQEALVLSGTSMLTPSVAGLVALMMEAGISKEDVKLRLKEASTRGAVSRYSLILRPITPNRLAYIPFEDIAADEYESFEVERVEKREMAEKWEKMASH